MLLVSTTKKVMFTLLVFFNCFFYSFSLRIDDVNPKQFCENSNVGDIIGNVTASGGVKPYTFTILTPEFATFVTLVDNGNYADLKLKRQFDRETPPEAFAVEFQVKDNDGQFGEPIEEVLSISDANDNAPFIENLPLNIDVKEYPWTEKFEYPFEVSDPDQGNGGAVTVSIPNSKYFEAILVNIASGRSNYTLVLKDGMQLNFENTPVLIFDIVAEDEGGDGSTCDTNTDPQSSTRTVVVNVIDGPNKPPFFTSTYDVNLDELTPLGAVVTTVSAQDRDYGLNWDMEYSIPSGQDAAKWFSINSSTGEVRVKEEIDRENSSIIESGGTIAFQVQAKEVVPDGNIFEPLPEVSFPFDVNTTITVRVGDVNDNRPTFYRLPDPGDTSIKFPEESFTANIDENTPNLISIPNLSIFVQDLDQGENSQFKLTDSSDVFDVFPTSANREASVVLRVANSSLLDFEKTKQFIFKIEAKESNFDARTATVTVYLNDINDNQPVFTNDFLTGNISENAEIGDEVVEVLATDEDEEGHQNITYSLNSNSPFRIDENTGMVYLNGELDRETVESYSLSVTATDSGGSSSTAYLTINVLDKNDNPPAFQRNSYFGTLLENAKQFNPPLVVTATDNDEADNSNSKITFSIVHGELKNLFQVDTEADENIYSGTVNPKNPIDMESLDLKSCQNGAFETILTVQATDEGDEPRSATVNLTITIEDSNDNFPKFSELTYSASIKERSSSGQYITQVLATDDDACSPYNDISYQIDAAESPDSLILFSMDSSTGILTVRDSELDRDEQSFLLVPVLAVDSGGERGAAEVNITLEDVNDKPPKFDQDDFNVFVSENKPIGQVVWTAIATDSDKDSNLDYSISNVRCFNPNNVEVISECENPFTMVNELQVGDLYVEDALDRERFARYSMVLSVEDLNAELNKNQQKVSQSLDIYINDTNDNGPSFNEANNEQDITVEEEMTGKLNITVREADDLDTPEFSKNYYFIIGGTAKEKFSLDPTTRILTVESKLNREESSSYDLVVTVNDDPNYQAPVPPVSWADVKNDSTMLHVIISVSDINDNPPVFVRDQYQADIPFDSEPNEGKIIVQVQAVDDDVDDNAEVTYQIVSTTWISSNSTPPENDLDVFGITISRDGLKGDMYQVGAIKTDESGQYEVEVSATDKDNKFKDSTTVIVRIIKQDETVVLFSALTTSEFSDVQDDFINELQVILDATVYVDSIVAHVPAEDEDFNLEILSDVSIHARKEGADNLIPKDEIVAELSKSSSAQFLFDYGIVDIEVNQAPNDNTQEYLIAGIIIAAVALFVVIAAFTVAIVCMRRKYNRKLRVAEATTSAVHEMADRNNKKPVPGLPNTNDFAGGANPLYEENENNPIDLKGWLDNQESNDDDSIDDNAVDNQDSAVGISDSKSVASTASDDGQNLEVDQFDIDFEKGDNARLAAALNAANQRRGEENFTFMFDENDGSTAM